MNLTKLKSMLQMQDALNTVVNPAWLLAGYPWHRAIMVEAVEALDHHGWKWWEATPEPDADQIRLELVDIWHFAMSLVLETHEGDIESASTTLFGYFTALEENPDAYGDIQNVSNVQLFDLLAGSAGIQRLLNGPAFNMLMKRFGLSWDRLYSMYVAKNVLNLFRQANGYKEGTYKKDWGGIEDNVALSALLVQHPDATAEVLTAKLDEIYKAL